MDYFGILERSFAITRRYRVLWVFGFLLALFSAGGGAGNGFQYTFQGNEVPPSQFAMGPSLGLILILVIVTLAIGLAILAAIINYVCQTALIGLVGEIEEGEDPTVRHGFDVGWSRSALRLFGVDIAIFVPVFLIAIFLALLIIVPLFMIADQGDLGPVVFVLLCCAAVFVPVIIAGAIILSILKTFFYRQVVLAGNSVFDAMRNGYRLVRANLGQVIAMWLIMFVIGLVWAAVNFLVGLVALAFVGGPAALMYAVFESGLAAVLGALPFLLPAIVIFAFINALYTVFTSAVWTLTYLELPKRPAE
ncbi:MAG: hypothetical protein MAG451_00004 [Anaerolineales bacterium]|nr:hypothetical protein [Anaerolineales bacterium]